MNFKDLSKKVRPDLIFFVIGFLVFPLVIIVSIYSIFNVKDDRNPVVSFPMDNLSVSISEVPVSNTVGNVNSDAMTSSITTVRTGHSEEGLNKSLKNQQQIQSTSSWYATQYSKGDIVKDTYIVQLGDTLWQIANAYYGSGEQWTKLLDQNSIGFLPNGEQALIVPGQILVLP